MVHNTVLLSINVLEVSLALKLSLRPIVVLFIKVFKNLI